MLFNTMMELEVTDTRAGVDRQPRQCTHHWIIEPHVQEVSRGICMICGAERLFRNEFRHTIASPNELSIGFGKRLIRRVAPTG